MSEDGLSPSAANMVAAASIGGAVAVLLIYGILIAASNSESALGQWARKWFSCLPWIPRELEKGHDTISLEKQRSLAPVRPEADEAQHKKDKKSRLQHRNGTIKLSSNHHKAAEAARQGLSELQEGRHRFADTLAEEDAAWSEAQSLMHEDENHKATKLPKLPNDRKVTFRSLTDTISFRSWQKSKDNNTSFNGQ